MKLINSQYTEYLVSQMTNFYSGYMQDANFYKVLMDAFTDAAFYIKDAADAAASNTTLNTVEIYHNDNIHNVTLNKALYNVNAIATAFHTETGSNWFDADVSLATKLAYLDKYGYYNYLYNHSTGEVMTNLIDIKLQQDYSTELPPYRRGTDFAINDSKIYAFNDLAKLPLYGVKNKTVLGRNLITDDNVLGKHWGVFIPEVTPTGIESFEYRDFLQTLIGFDSTIASIRKAVTALSFGSLADKSMFRDTYSRKNVSIDFLKNPPSLGPFEFIYKLPPEFAGLMNSNGVYPAEYEDTYVRLTNIMNFLKIMKPAHTNFYLSTAVTIKDPLNVVDSLGLALTYNNTIVDPLNIKSAPRSKVKSTFASGSTFITKGVYGQATYGIAKYGVTTEEVKSNFQDSITLKLN